MLTPIPQVVTVGAGGIERLSLLSRYLLLSQIAGAATVQLGFDSDPPQALWAGLRIDTERKYKTVVLVNTGAGPVTVRLLFSETPVDDQAAVLAASAFGAMNQLALVNIAITGGAGTLLFPANAARQIIEIVAAESNGGFVYLGDAAANVSALDYFMVLYPGGIWWSEHYKGAIFAVGDDALEWAGGSEV